MFSLYKIMCYILHSGKKTIPLHVMTAYNVCEKCKSRETITSINHIGVSVSYRLIWKSRSELVQYTLHQCERLYIPLYPVTFPKKCLHWGI